MSTKRTSSGSKYLTSAIKGNTTCFKSIFKILVQAIQVPVARIYIGEKLLVHFVIIKGGIKLICQVPFKGIKDNLQTLLGVN